MEERAVLNEHASRNRKHRAEIRARRGQGEKRSAVSGVKGVRADVSYVYLYSWSASFYEGQLNVFATVQGAQSNTIKELSIELQSIDDHKVNATAEIQQLSQEVSSATLFAETAVSIPPRKVYSRITGTVISNGNPVEIGGAYGYSIYLDVRNASDQGTGNR